MKKISSIVILLALAVAAFAQEAPHKYEIKSGIVKTATQVMGQTTEVIVYFDEYGALETTRTKMTIPGMGEMDIATITKDGKSYMVNNAQKQVQEMPIQESVNYLALTDEMKEKFKIVDLGKEKVGEWDCTKYGEEISQMGQTAKLTVWVWKGFPVKTVTNLAGMEVVSEVTEFEEDAFILPQTFEVPQF